jgi:hypothetical protein
MNEQIEIKGGAGDFESAVIAVVVDRLAQEEKSAAQTQPDLGLSRWKRVLEWDDSPLPVEIPRPR